MGWGGRCEGVSRGRGHKLYLWFILIDVRLKQTQYCKVIILQSIVNTFNFKKNIEKKREAKKYYRP